MTAAGPDTPLSPCSGPRSEASPNHSELDGEIQPLLEQIQAIASQHGGDPIALLGLLRHLEELHRSIQDGAFRASLPSDRSSLFQLLQDMELSGGWPYIPRLQLRTFLDLLQQDPHPTSEEPSANVAEAA